MTPDTRERGPAPPREAPAAGRVVVFLGDDSVDRDVLLNLRGMADAKLVAGWDELDQLAPEAACSLVVLASLFPSPDTLRLAGFKAAHPLAPLVLVTRKDADNARNLCRLTADEVVWSREVGRELLPALKRVRRTRSSVETAAAIRSASHVPAALRELLADACEGPRVVATVSELARVAGLNRSTLGRQWRVALGDRPPMHLGDFLEWLVLVRALETKTRTVPWDGVARGLGVHRSTLRRYFVQRCGIVLQGADAAAEEILRAFADRALGLLLAPPVRRRAPAAGPFPEPVPHGSATLDGQGNPTPLITFLPEASEGAP